MVKFKLPIKDILGLSYYRYELSSDNYNPTYNSTITITCNCRNIFGNKVTGKELKLYENDTLIGTETTDEDGTATFETTVTNSGIRKLNVSNENIHINVNRWKTVTLTTGSSYGTLYVNEELRMAELRYVRDFNSATADTFYAWHTGAIPQEYRPSSQVNGSMNQVGVLYVDSTGEIGGKFANSWSSTRTVRGTTQWHY